MERGKKNGTNAIYCLRWYTEHMARSFLMKQMIYLQKAISRKSLNKRDPVLIGTRGAQGR